MGGGESMDSFNENVELLLAKKGIRKKELIAHLGISKSAFYAKLVGQRPWFLDEAVRIAEFLKVPIGKLI